MNDGEQNNEERRDRISRLEQKVRDLEAALAGSFATLSGLQEREEMFRLLVTHMPDVAWTSDDRGRTVYISPRVEEVYGFTPEEIASSGNELWFGRIHEDDRQRVRDAYEAMFASGAAFDIEYRIRHKQGHWIWLHDRAFSRYTKEGRKYAHGVFRDVSSQKQAGEALREEKNRSEAIIAAIGDGISIQGRDYRVLYQNDVHKGFVGRHIGDLCYEAYESRDSTCEGCPVALAFADGRVHITERTVTLGGETRHFEISASPLRDASDEIIAGIEVVREVTARRRAEELLWVKDAALASSLNAIALADLSGRITYANRALLELWGYGPDEVMGMSTLDFWSEPSEAARAVAAVLEEDGWSGELLAKKKNGTAFPVELTASLVRDKDGTPLCMMGSFIDITRRRMAEEDRRRSGEQTRLLIDSMPVGCIMWDPAFRAILWNPAAERIFGYTAPEVLGKHAYDLIVPREFHAKADEIWSGLMSGDQAAHSVNGNLRADGRAIVCEWYNTPLRDADGNVTGVLSMVLDVTRQREAEEERKRLQAQLLQSQKMEAVGLLAGGVAHDFNNILSAILGYASIVQMKMRPDDPLRPHVEQVLAAAQRAAGLTQSLLAFSRKQVINPRPVDVNETLRRIETLLRRLIGEDIEFITHYRTADLTVLADTTQLEQVIINLATNARDAMPRGGTLTVETGRVAVGEDFVREHGEGRAGRYGTITVTDTGAGMDEETRSRIFEPFFTTKEMGKGTGLGLSTVYGIVTQSGGFVTCDSVRGKGSTFRVYLPAVPAPSAAGETAPSGRPGRGTETVLVAEDDAATRALIGTLFADHGYRVITAADGEEALARLREHAGEIGLLILDVIMPKRNGKEVLDKARELRPDIRALFISGYTSDIIQAKTLLSEHVRLVTKPFMPDALLREAREALEAP